MTCFYLFSWVLGSVSASCLSENYIKHKISFCFNHRAFWCTSVSFSWPPSVLITVRHLNHGLVFLNRRFKWTVEISFHFGPFAFPALTDHYVECRSLLRQWTMTWQLKREKTVYRSLVRFHPGHCFLFPDVLGFLLSPSHLYFPFVPEGSFCKALFLRYVHAWSLMRVSKVARGIGSWSYRQWASQWGVCGPNLHPLQEQRCS